MKTHADSVFRWVLRPRPPDVNRRSAAWVPRVPSKRTTRSFVGIGPSTFTGAVIAPISQGPDLDSKGPGYHDPRMPKSRLVATRRLARSLIRCSSSLFSATLLSCLVACGSSSEEATSAVQPDLILFLVDGLRDGAGPLGRAADALRAELDDEGRHRFTAAYTQSIEPYVALGSLLSGRYPSAIPLCGRPHYTGRESADPWCLPLPEPVHTLPEVLGYYGYETAFFSTVAPDHPSLIRGFGTKGVPDPGAANTELTVLHQSAQVWWEAHAGAPRLLVVQAPLDLGSLRPLILDIDHGAFATAWGQERANPLPNTDPDRYKQPYGGDAPDWSRVDQAYDALAAEAGAGIQSLLSSLSDLGTEVERPRWVVTTSLRGVSLGELSGTEHAEQLVPAEASLLLERTVHVPLDVYHEGGSEDTVDYPVELVDIAPTFYALGQAVLPVEGAGQDLLGPAPASPRAYAEYGDMLLLRRGTDLVNFRAERHGTSSLSPTLTLALVDPQHTERPGTFRLSRVSTDPNQEHDLSRSNEASVKMFQAELVEIRQGVGAPPPDALTPERVKQLQDLRANGYW
jgi:arylsulfatase A-like enzyme